MADQPPKSATPKVFDIAAPNQTTTSATSRPVIVGNRAILQKDPMMVESKSTEKADASGPTHQEKVVKPLVITTDEPEAEQEPTLAVVSTNEKKDEVEPTLTDPGNDVAEKPAPIKVSEPLPKPAEPAKEEPKPEAEQEPEDTEDLITDATDDIKAAKESKAKQEVDEARQAELEKWITEGKYAVPINAVKRKRNRMVALSIIFLLLVGGVAAFDLLLDAGILHIDGVPHTNFLGK